MLMQLALLVPAIFFAGALIGATGIGGVLLVPLLTGLGDIPLPAAIAASSLAFAFPALVALRPILAQPSLIAQAWPLLIGGLLGAGLGANSLQFIAPHWLTAGVAALVLFAGLRGLRSPRTPRPDAPLLGQATLLAIGLAVGLGSALTGTGGPVLLLPVLMLLRQPLAFAVLAAQAIQLPISLSSSVVHWQAQRLDVALALGCGLVLLLGSMLGQHYAQRLPRQQLQRAVSVLLLLVGAWFVAKLLHLA